MSILDWLMGIITSVFTVAAIANHNMWYAILTGFLVALWIIIKQPNER